MKLAFLRGCLSFCAWTFLLASVLAGPAQAQLASPTPAETTVPTVASDPYDRGSPRSTITALLNALAADDFDRAARYFSNVPDASRIGADEEAIDEAEARRRVKEGAELARKLKMALDSGGALKAFALLSNEADGDLEDGLDPLIEDVGTFKTGDEQVPVLLRRSAIGDPLLVQWRVSSETIEALSDWRPDPTVEARAEPGAFQVGGADLKDWILLVGLGTVLFAALRLLAAIVLAALRAIIPDHSGNAVYRLGHAALPPLALYGATVAFFVLASTMEASIIARQALLRVAGIAAWISLGWFLFRLVDAVARLGSERMHRAERRQAASIITLARRVVKLTLLVIIAIAVLDTFGVDVTTGIAALGIGGLALALGAQKTIENLVGSVTIIGDHPIQVGDAAQIGNVFGTIEDVGMRSTRVRTVNRTLVTIPNGFLAGEKIENFSARDQFLFKHVIGVSYDTDAEKLEDVLTAFRQVLDRTDHIFEEDARARFIGFGESALNIEIFAYFRTTSFVESLEMQEDLLLDLMRVLNDLDVEIAFPTRTLHLDASGTTASSRRIPSRPQTPTQENEN